MTDDFERRIRDAVASEGAGVQPDDASLATIRHRVAMSKRRRLVGGTALGAAAALVIGIAIGVAAGGDDTTDVAAGGGSTTTTVPCPTTTAPATATTGPPSSVAASTTTSIVTDDGSNSPLTMAPETTVPPTGPGNTETVVHQAEEPAEANCGAPTTATTGTVPTTGTTATESTTTTTIPSDELAVYPQADDTRSPAERLDPVATARTFLTVVVGIRDPALGPFVSTDANRGTISLYNGHGAVEPGAVERSFLELVQRPSGEWVIHSARSAAIRIDSINASRPEQATSVTVAGTGRGFEGVLHVLVQGEGTGVGGTTMASGGEELAPFETSLDLQTAPRTISVIVFNDSGEEGGSVDVAAEAVEAP